MLKLLAVISLLIVIPIIYFIGYFLYKYINFYSVESKLALLSKYISSNYKSNNNWIMITGATSGIGLAIINEICKLSDIYICKWYEN